MLERVKRGCMRLLVTGAILVLLYALGDYLIPRFEPVKRIGELINVEMSGIMMQHILLSGAVELLDAHLLAEQIEAIFFEALTGYTGAARRLAVLVIGIYPLLILLLIAGMMLASIGVYGLFSLWIDKKSGNLIE